MRIVLDDGRDLTWLKANRPAKAPSRLARIIDVLWPLASVRLWNDCETLEQAIADFERRHLGDGRLAPALTVDAICALRRLSDVWSELRATPESAREALQAAGLIEVRDVGDHEPFLEARLTLAGQALRRAA